MAEFHSRSGELVAESLHKSNFSAAELIRLKPRPLTVAQRAKLLGVTAKALKPPLTLSPLSPAKGASRLLLFAPLMVDAATPVESGQALFSSQFPGPALPGAQVAFPRKKKGKPHLVEFHVHLNVKDLVYQFRVFHYPLGGFQDVSLSGGKAEVIVMLVPAVDQVDGQVELGAAIQQRNSPGDFAGWVLHAVRISAAG